MEYAGGGDLSQRIKSAKETKMFFSEAQILNWFVQICLALRYIHSKYVSYHSAK
jgi:NIMA (never in mitosis gene a)-related kinase 1/4/5